MALEPLNVLAVDAGSSSLKLALYEMPSERRIDEASVAVGSSSESLASFVASLRERDMSIDAVVHRIVFGGPGATQPQRATPEELQRIEGFVPMHPVHLRIELDAIAETQRLLPAIAQWLCFDTVFHERMPALAKRYPLGPEFEGIRRYGYHGLSYEYIVSTLPKTGRFVIAHLGSGASMAAVRDGEPMDTTMGFSPLGGIMMGTRPGDLDPGVLLYAMEELGIDARRLRDALTRHSGLLGASQSTSDMRELLERETHDERAREAVELFVYIAAKAVGALATALGGIDRLIFTGGIGENARVVRDRICARLAYLNAESFVVPTNEALAMCRHVWNGK